MNRSVQAGSVIVDVSEEIAIVTINREHRLPSPSIPERVVSTQFLLAAVGSLKEPEQG